MRLRQSTTSGLIPHALAIALAASVPIQTAAATEAARPQRSDCRPLIADAERRYGIPQGLLAAIAITESGLQGIPNPWALNIAGRSHHASTPQEALMVISQNLQRGTRSIDVGCMQINIKHHGHRFGSIVDMIDLRKNVDYGAWYLVHNAARHGSWYEAVMSYHNKTNQSRRRWYGCLVWNNWVRITGRGEPIRSCGHPPSGSGVAAADTPRTASFRHISNRPAGNAAAIDSYQRWKASTGLTIQIPYRPETSQGRMELYLETAPGQARLQQPLEADPRAASFRPIRPISWQPPEEDENSPWPDVVTSDEPDNAWISTANLTGARTRSAQQPASTQASGFYRVQSQRLPSSTVDTGNDL